MHEIYVNQSSIIHNLNPRVKIILALGLLIFLNLTPPGAWPAYILFLSITIALAIGGSIDLRVFFVRSLVVLPLVIAALPLIFIRPISLQSFLDFQLIISPVGMVRFFSILVKAWISIQVAIILTATTRFDEMMLALQHLSMPDILVTTIRLMWRYLFIFVDEVKRMMRARNSRSSRLDRNKRSGGSVFWRAKVTGNMTGYLFIRAIERSDRVYAAMLSRGFDGQIPASDQKRLSKDEWKIIFSGAIILCLLWIIGFLFGG